MLTGMKRVRTASKSCIRTKELNKVLFYHFLPIAVLRKACEGVVVDLGKTYWESGIVLHIGTSKLMLMERMPTI